MIHTEKMTQGHNGMRKGISLVEMLVAIVLFGIIGTIGYTYYKNYYNTAYAGKQVRIYTIVEQATQLSNAYDLYVAKHGSEPEDINAMVDDKILTEIPAMMPTLTTTGWVLDKNMSIEHNATTAGDIAFKYVMDVTDGNLSTASKLDYCNILNNVAYSDWNLSSTDADINGSTVFYTLGTTDGKGELEYFHCADINESVADESYDFQFVFAK